MRSGHAIELSNAESIRVRDASPHTAAEQIVGPGRG
jgi:hypothetical protein